MNNAALRLLLIEDCAADALLVVQHLETGGFAVQWERVDTAPQMGAALEQRAWDLIIADYAVPGFEAPAALALLQQTGRDIPFLVVSGTIGEERAVALLKAGARDFLSKGNLARLVPAVTRELREAQGRWQRQQADAAQQRLSQQMRSLLESTGEGIYGVDQQGCCTFINRAGAALLGRAPEEVLGRNMHELIHHHKGDGTVFPKADCPIFQAFQAGQPRRLDTEVFWRPDGTSFPVEYSSHPIREGGAITGAVIAFSDITQRKQLQLELQWREQWLNSFFSNATVGLCILDRELRYVQINETLARINGRTVQEHLGRAVREVLPNLAPTLEGLARRVLETGQPVLNLEISGETSDRPGELRHWIDSLFPLLDETGHPMGVGAVVVEVTDRKRAEAALRESEEKFRQLAENINMVFWISNLEMTEVLYVSPAYEQIWGRSCHSLYQQPLSWVEAIHPADQERVYATLQAAKDGAQFAQEYRILRPDGSVRWIHDRSILVRNEAGDCYRRAGLAEDITARKQLEEQFRQAQKMDAIGQLAGGVAHDFNNILAATLMHLGLLQRRPGLAEDIKGVVQELEGEATRAANLTRQLLLFSRRQQPRFDLLDLNEVVQNLLKMLRRLLGENLELAFAPAPAAAWVKADAGMLEQVVMNLCVNARDAMPKGGRLTLTTQIVELEAQAATTHPEARPGRFVCLEVSDSGCGMPEAVLKRLFEPFFTTKAAGKGTGLGLATVYGIVKQHEGWLTVQSQVGHGSSFRVYLPAAPNGGPAPAAASAPEEIKGGSETILLVEDELSLRRSAALCLRKLGYGVLEAANATEALQVWAQHREHIALLLTDQVMPGPMTGWGLGEHLRAQQPQLKVILSSGYSDQLGQFHATAGNSFAFLAKPYRAATLAKQVRRCLDAEPSRPKAEP